VLVVLSLRNTQVISPQLLLEVHQGVMEGRVPLLIMMKTEAPTMGRGNTHLGEEANKQQRYTQENRELQSGKPHVSVDARSWKMVDTGNNPMH
jgi:hypothetical protein